MATRRIDTQTLTGIADAIRAKKGGASAMTPAEMVTEIGNISGGGSQITKDEWTLTSDFSSNTQGFFYSSYCDRTFGGMQLFHYANNNATNYCATIAFVDNAKTGASTSAFRCINNGNQVVTGSSSGYPYNISAGTTITRFKMDYQGV